MHQFDQFKQDMEKMSKAKLTNPIKSEQIKPERSYLDMTELNRNDPDYSELLKRLSNIPCRPITGEVTVTNLNQFVDSQTIPNCTVLTIDGIDGFAWIDQNGTRHDEGFVWPTMRIHKDATVEILFGKNGERSAGWKKDDGRSD